jgi:hypothetical protein
MRPLLILALAISFAAAMDNPSAALEALKVKQKAETLAAAKAWIKTADVTPVVVPKLGPDPRQSERKEVEDAEMAAQLVNTLGQWKERIAKGDKEAEQALYDWFRSLEPTNAQVAALVRIRSH